MCRHCRIHITESAAVGHTVSMPLCCWAELLWFLQKTCKSNFCKRQHLSPALCFSHGHFNVQGLIFSSAKLSFSLRKDWPIAPGYFPRKMLSGMTHVGNWTHKHVYKVYKDRLFSPICLHWTCQNNIRVSTGWLLTFTIKYQTKKTLSAENDEKFKLLESSCLWA